MTRGRPLRFLGVVLAGWTGLRVAMLWPGVASLPLAGVAAHAARGASAAALHARFGPVADHPERRPFAFVTAAVPPRPSTAPPASGDLPAPLHAAAAARAGTSGQEGEIASQPAAQLAAERSGRRSRLAADGWLVVRPTGGDNLAFGQLGGTQGGARVTYALDAARRLSLSARLSAPLRGRGAEAAIGFDLRPTSLPAHLLVEERVGLDGGGARPAAGLIAGASAALVAGVRLDAYGQAGAVWKRGGFADGAALVTHAVLDRRAARVEVGGGAWGAAQRRASRLDVGPSAALVVPAGGATLRLQLDYRARVAGDARPGSGPALSLGGSF